MMILTFEYWLSAGKAVAMGPAACVVTAAGAWICGAATV